MSKLIGKYQTPFGGLNVREHLRNRLSSRGSNDRLISAIESEKARQALEASKRQQAYENLSREQTERQHEATASKDNAVVRDNNPDFQQNDNPNIATVEGNLGGNYVNNLANAATRLNNGINNVLNTSTIGMMSNGSGYMGYGPRFKSTVGADLSTAAAGIGSLVAPITLPSLAPGSAFWANPLTRQMVTGMLGGEGLNLASQLFNGNTWGQNVGHATNILTGYNPNNHALGRLITNMSNPGYIYSTPERLISLLPRPKINSTYTVTPMEEFIENGDLNKLYEYIPKLSRATNTPENTIKNIITDFYNQSPTLTPKDRGLIIKQLGYNWDGSVDLNQLSNGVRNILQSYHYNALPFEKVENYVRLLKDKGIYLDRGTARSNLASGFSDPEQSIKRLGDLVDGISQIPKTDNLTQYMSPELIAKLQEAKISPETLRFLRSTSSFKPTTERTSDFLTKIQHGYSPEQLKLVDEMVNFSPEKGLSGDIADVLNLNLKRHILHPDIPRPNIGEKYFMTNPDGTVSEVPVEAIIKKDIENKIKKAIDNPFTVGEQTGFSFSSSSMPMIWKAATRIINARAKNGQFPGYIVPRGGTTYGNKFGNVNLGEGFAHQQDGTLKWARARIGEPFGRIPTEEEILTFPNRQGARDFINLNAARTYKTLQRNSKYPGAPDYGFDEGLLDQVIQAKGNIDAVPGAAQMMFKDRITPLWTQFPEGLDHPVYPALQFYFKNGGKVKPKLVSKQNK